MRILYTIWVTKTSGPDYRRPKLRMPHDINNYSIPITCRVFWEVFRARCRIWMIKPEVFRWSVDRMKIQRYLQEAQEVTKNLVVMVVAYLFWEEGEMVMISKMLIEGKLWLRDGRILKSMLRGEKWNWSEWKRTRNKTPPHDVVFAIINDDKR